MSRPSLIRELGVVIVVGLLSALIYFEWFWNSMWVLVYLRHWTMSFGYYVDDGSLLNVLSFMGGVSALLVALLGLRLLMKRSYSIRRGLVYGLIAGLLGATLSTAMMIAYIYSLGVDLPTIASEKFRLLHPQSIWSALYWLLVSIPGEWTFLIGASIGGMLSAIIRRVPKSNTKTKKTGVP